MGIYKHSTAPIKVDTGKAEVDKKFIKDGFQNNEVFTRAYLALQDLFGVCEIDWADYDHSYVDKIPYVTVMFNVPMPEGCRGPEFQLCVKVADYPTSYEYEIRFKKDNCPIKLYYDGPTSVLRLSDVTPDMMEDIVKTGIKKTWVKRFKDDIREFEEQQLRLKQDLMKSQLNALEIVPKVNEILQGYGIKPMVQYKIDKDEDDYVTYKVVETEDSEIRLNISPKDVDLEISSYIDTDYSAENIMIAIIETVNSANDCKLETSIEIKHINKLYDYINRIGHTLAVANQLKDIWKWGRQKK